MAKVRNVIPNAIEKLRKITTAWVRCTSVTDNRQKYHRRTGDSWVTRCWSSLCHCHPIISFFIKIQTGNSSDNFSSYLPENHHSSDDVYTGGEASQQQILSNGYSYVTATTTAAILWADLWSPWWTWHAASRSVVAVAPVDLVTQAPRTWTVSQAAPCRKPSLTLSITHLCSTASSHDTNNILTHLFGHYKWHLPYEDLSVSKDFLRDHRSSCKAKFFYYNGYSQL